MGSDRRLAVPKQRIDDAFEALDQVLTAAEAIEALLAQPGWNHLQRFVQAEVEAIDLSLDRGGDPPSRAEYAKAHGRKGGLLYIADAAHAIIARADQRYREQQAKHERGAEPSREGVPA